MDNLDKFTVIWLVVILCWMVLAACVFCGNLYILVLALVYG